MRVCRGRGDLIRELLNFPGKVRIEIQPEGPIAHKIKEGNRTLVEDEHKHSTFQGQWGYSRNPRTPEKALLCAGNNREKWCDSRERNGARGGDG